MPAIDYLLRPVGVIRSPLQRRDYAPKQGCEGAPDAWVEIDARSTDGLRGLAVGDEVILITWLHEARRDTLQVHPRGDRNRPLAGVFATRSPDRPNPLGLHRVTICEIATGKLKVGPVEVIDGTPVVDIKPVLAGASDA